MSAATAGQVAPSDALIKVKAASAVSPRVLRLISISLCSTRLDQLQSSVFVGHAILFVHRCDLPTDAGGFRTAGDASVT